ncbi:MAG: YidC/Oxa1 family membrane protein insertase [Treponema sp.]|nr:YidC/Oxa1 family membrane protein insertase [Treponema sp.]
MSVFLYTVIIAPIIQIIEVSFVFFYKVFHSFAIPIAGVSFTVFLLSLPFYIMAEYWQKTERETALRLKPTVKKIKSVFKGDEQFMLLSTYYRQNNYHPLYTLRNSFGIFVQIPFFIAAYSYLSNLELLHGVNIFYIKDISMPDAMIKFNSITINILPIIMTIINLISGYIYVRNLSLGYKFQVYITAFIFLVLLYNSPSALVLYWTINNILFLIKNILYKMKKPLFILYFIGCFIILLLIIYLIFFMLNRVLKKRLLVVFILSLYFFMPLFHKIFQNLQKYCLSKLIHNKKNMTIIFLTSCISLALLSGLFIPSTVIASSPDEFSFIGNYYSPFVYLSHSSFFYFGLFFLWPVCTYFLVSDRSKTFLTLLLAAFALVSSINTVIFSGNYGKINNIFNFNTTVVLRTSYTTGFISLFFVLLVIALIIIMIYKNKLYYLISSITIIILFFSAVSAYNFIKISKSFNELEKRHSEFQDIVSIEPVFSLSKNEKNVIVIMADGSVNGFIPIIFNDFPELYGQFDGFTLFRNTASFSNHTLMGVPPVWGGYDYTPTEMNFKSHIPLVKKHNEALLTLPLLLTEAGFNVTVTDPSWANYAWIPDTSIYDDYEKITAFNTERHYTELWYLENEYEATDFTTSKIKRNIIWFSFLKINIPAARTIIYDNGWYWNTDKMGNSIYDFINSYAVLDYLCNLTSFNSTLPSALLITNELTHKYGYLRQPGNKPSGSPDKIGNSKYAELDSYHANVAMYLQLGKWLELLKANGIYDNTRIIITADHGNGIRNLISDEPLSIKDEKKESYNPVLLLKDFNSKGDLIINNDFMTNADVPALTLIDLLENPLNPFTGNPVNMEPKKNGILVTTCHIAMADGHGKNRFNIKNNQWVHVNNSIFESSNWVNLEK